MKKFEMILGASMLAAAVGCSGAEGTEVGDASSDDVGSQTATVLYSDKFADDGELLVVEQDDGALGIQVRAPIRSERASQAARKAFAQATLAEVYETLNEGAPAPLEIRALSERVAAKRALAKAEPSAPAIEQPIFDIQGKTKEAFVAAYCKNISLGGLQWLILEHCKYNNFVNRVTTDPVMKGDDATGYYDRSYVWNDSSWTATHNLSGRTWTTSWPPGDTGWTQWGGTYAGARAQLTLPSNKNGPIGITAHDFIIRIH